MIQGGGDAIARLGDVGNPVLEIGYVRTLASSAKSDCRTTTDG
jgi:hypothetical protein